MLGAELNHYYILAPTTVGWLVALCNGLRLFGGVGHVCSLNISPLYLQLLQLSLRTNYYNHYNYLQTRVVGVVGYGGVSLNLHPLDTALATL